MHTTDREMIHARIASYILVTAGVLLILCGLILIGRFFENQMIELVAVVVRRAPKLSWSNALMRVGFFLAAGGAALVIIGGWLLPGYAKFQGMLTNGYAHFEAAMRNSFGKWIAFDRPAETQEQSEKNWQNSIPEWLLIPAFLLIAGFLFLSRIQQEYPLIHLGGDSANLASFAAAEDFPRLFKGDEMIGDTLNFGIYKTLNIPLTSLLARWTGNYGLGFAVQIIPQIFLQLLGFYLLGKALFKNRFWALMLTLAAAAPINLNTVGETWGISQEPVTRFWFQAILPFLLALVLLWRDRPGRWPMIMALAGLLAFVHPVSTPAWGAALWLGYWALMPGSWHAQKRMIFLACLGLTYLLFLLPYGWIYFNNRSPGVGPSYDLFYHVVNTYFPPDLLNIPAAFMAFLKTTLRSGLLPFALLNLILLGILKGKGKNLLVLLIAWMAGIFVISVLLPWIEHLVEYYFRIVPLETELIRGIRYFIPLMLIVCVWGLAELERRIFHPARYTMSAIGLGLVCLWLFNFHPPLENMRAALNCFRSGHVICPVDSDESRLIRAIVQSTAPNSRFFTTFANEPKMAWSLDIRYLALRPLVYSWKDRGMLVYSSADRLEKWSRTNDELASINDAQISVAERLDRYQTLGQELGADYLIVDFHPPDNPSSASDPTMIYQNSTYTIIKLH